MEKVNGIGIGLRLAAALAIATTMSSCTKPSRQEGSLHPPAGSAALTRIVIDDDWDGYSPLTPIRSHWVIEPRGSGYVLYGTRSQSRIPQGSDDGSRLPARDVTNVPAESIPTPAVNALVHALRAPTQSSIDLALFGSTVNHASTMIDEQVKGMVALAPSQASRQRIVDWGNRVRQGKPLADAVTAGVDSATHSDDYPHARVEASFTDGSNVVFSSDSQNTLMLPWHDDSGRKTFSGELSQALAGVLPSASTDRIRLSLMPAQGDFDGALRAGIRDSFTRSKAQVMAPEAYASLQSRFAIESVETDPFPSDFDSTSDSLMVLSGLPAGPSNLVVSASLKAKGSALANTADLDGIATALNTAVTSTALRRAILANPGEQFLIQHGVGARTFDDGAKKRFIMQMSEAHKLPELGAHPELLDGAVFVMESDDVLIKGPRTRSPTYWIALRDGRAVALTRLGVGGNDDAHPVRVYGTDENAL